MQFGEKKHSAVKASSVLSIRFRSARNPIISPGLLFSGEFARPPVTLLILIDSPFNNQLLVLHKTMESPFLLWPMTVLCKIFQFFVASTREDSLVFFPKLPKSFSVHGVEPTRPIWYRFWKRSVVQVGFKLILREAGENAVPYEPV
jgi:hypothetical protein